MKYLSLKDISYTIAPLRKPHLKIDNTSGFTLNFDMRMMYPPFCIYYYYSTPPPYT